MKFINDVPTGSARGMTMNPRVKRFNEDFHWFKDFVSLTRVFCKLATEKRKIEAHF
jgi:hypothetical protein